MRQTRSNIAMDYNDLKITFDRSLRISTIKMITVSLAVFFLTIANLVSASSGPKYSHTGATIITNVAVIDGLGNPPVSGQDIILVDGKIAAIGATGSVKAPNGALKIDGTGMTAMPGLMDLHIHTQGGMGKRSDPW
jgi:hypothetical protein